VTWGGLYQDGKHYDAIAGKLEEDLEFYRQMAAGCSALVLDLACGTGRVTVPLARAGLKVWGLEINPAMLRLAREKAQHQNLKIEFIQADMRDFNLAEKFELIFIAYNSMQHLLDDLSLEMFFTSVKKHLLPHGRLIIDIFNPSMELLAREKGARFAAGNLAEANDQGEFVIEEEVNYNDAEQINHIKWYYSLRAGFPQRVDEFSLRCFFPREMRLILKHYGFKILNCFGNHNKKPFAPGDLKQIYVCCLA
jgi:SAM-dependent methyltransferase